MKSSRYSKKSFKPKRSYNKNFKKASKRYIDGSKRNPRNTKKNKVKRNKKNKKKSNKRSQKGGYMLPVEYFGGKSGRFFDEPFVNPVSDPKNGKYSPVSFGVPNGKDSHGPNLFRYNMKTGQK